ncbi:MAG: stationary phase survival protein SurE, partial [Tissierellia bacterium]|nr:stationary phase survival protein SurE [Tissierellia bacterium]
SMALSAEYNDRSVNYDIAVKYGRYILERSKEDFIKDNIVLSINTPFLDEDQVKGMKVCKIGGIVYDYYSMDHNDSGDEIILTLKRRRENALEKDTDRYYLSKGYVTITPIHYNLTNFDLLKKVKGWL